MADWRQTPGGVTTPSAGKVLLGQIESMDFQQQIDFLRGAVLNLLAALQFNRNGLILGFLF